MSWESSRDLHLPSLLAPSTMRQYEPTNQNLPKNVTRKAELCVSAVPSYLGGNSINNEEDNQKVFTL